MEFYNLRTRSKVDIADGKISKCKMKRETKSGTQIRYALIGEHDGNKLYKFVNEKDFNSKSYPEVDPPKKKK